MRHELKNVKEKCSGKCALNGTDTDSNYQIRLVCPWEENHRKSGAHLNFALEETETYVILESNLRDTYPLIFYCQ